MRRRRKKKIAVIITLGHRNWKVGLFLLLMGKPFKRSLLGTIWHLRGDAMVYCQEARGHGLEFSKWMPGLQSLLESSTERRMALLPQGEDGLSAIVAKVNILCLVSARSNHSYHQNKGTIYWLPYMRKDFMCIIFNRCRKSDLQARCYPILQL